MEPRMYVVKYVWQGQTHQTLNPGTTWDKASAIAKSIREKTGMTAWIELLK